VVAVFHVVVGSGVVCYPALTLGMCLQFWNIK